MRTPFIFFLFIPFFLFAQSGNDEFRATWVISWEHMAAPAEEGKANIRQILDDHVAANMNAVLFQVRQSGTAYYDSPFEPWGYYAGYENPGYDPLEYAIQEAHKRGLELHAWFNVFQASSMREGAPAYEHPEWVCRDQSGNAMSQYRALSPGLSAVREYTRDVAMDIVNNYDIDGLHLDYVRWNEYSDGQRSAPTIRQEESILDGRITETQAEALQNGRSGRYLYDVEHPYSGGVPTGFASWEDWWRWSVTEFVTMLHDSIQSVKPYVRLSTAVLGKYNWSGWQGYGVVYQDAALWYNEGYIEQLTPMHYHWTNASGFTGMLVNNCPDCWSDYIQDGINASRLYTVGPGSYILDEYGVWKNHASIVNASRTIGWVKGFQFFSYGTWSFHDYWDVAGNSFFGKKTFIPETISDNSIQPDPPVITGQKPDDLHYVITCTPSDSSASSWFAIYRSDDDTLNKDSAELIYTHFGDSTFSYTDTFDGTQTFNGRYTYFATQANRYWKHSGASNAFLSDSIPSYAPTVITSFPVPNDTVAVNIKPKILFSKTMAPETAQNAIAISPTLPHNLSWSNNNKEVTLNIFSRLEYATTYSITINSQLTDVNGLGLDSDADGIPDDNYILQFHTFDEDIFGPVISSSTLNIDNPNYYVDIGQVITVAFDEIVKASTLNTSSIQLLKNASPVSYNIHISDLNASTIFTLRSEANRFSANASYELVLSDEISDPAGNTMTPVTIPFTTEAMAYDEITLIEPFDNTTNWWDPTGSGSTVGILAGTSFGTNNAIYVPGTDPSRSARLSYVWDPDASAHLLREYLSGGAPRAVEFDTSYTLECYIYGDGSHNYFRFALDDNLTAASGHEVSEWFEIDWTGWKLIRWDLGSDPVGSWIGDGVLNGTLRTDSFQMTYNPEYQVTTGAIYFDDYRIVKKSYNLSTGDETPPLPDQLALYPNFPNPFNPVTNIYFDLPREGNISIAVYDILGRKVRSLINKPLPAGHHKTTWNGTNDFGSSVSSGMYFCRLITDYDNKTIRMTFTK